MDYRFFHYSNFMEECFPFKIDRRNIYIERMFCMFIIKRPFKLCKNRVWRTYTGGKLLEQWEQGKATDDSNFPEEWILSATKAVNVGREEIMNEGLSFVEFEKDKIISLPQLIKIDPELILGKEHYENYGQNLALLVKMLDSAERLTIQVHPDIKTAKELFNSKYGKTEAWYVVDKRDGMDEKPYVLLGFKKGITKEKWLKLFEEQDIDGMINSLHKFYVEPGEVYIVNGGIPHAIGAGCLLMEIQEPTDYTIRVERITPKGLKIRDELCHQGLGFDKMFECFHYDGLEKEQVKKSQCPEATVLRKEKGFLERELIGLKDISLFKLVSIEVDDAYEFQNTTVYSSITILSGKGKLIWDNDYFIVEEGQSYFLPACVQNLKFESLSGKTTKIIRCFPPNSTNHVV